jgi:alcohol dehydrogenase class IV
VFEDVEADPPSHVIERAVGLCRDKGIGLVASIGGGSALDTAKLVAYLAKTCPYRKLNPVGEQRRIG